MQSINLVLAMLVLLYILLKYRKEPPAADKAAKRPLNFWQWSVRPALTMLSHVCGR